MNRDVLIPLLLGLLAMVALGYFALIVWKAERFADALLPRGYESRGWTRDRLTVRMRVLGAAGCAVSLGAIVLAAMRVAG